jgi:uncharacterized protein YbjT (DUF2867 family)
VNPASTAEHPILVTGAPGNVGTPIVRQLLERGEHVRVAAFTPGRAQERLGLDDAATERLQVVRFDFLDSSTWEATFDGVNRMFLLRPPQLSRPLRDMVPALEHARAGGLSRVVFLSVQGAGNNSIVPHRKIEDWLRSTDIDWTFIRASYFMQNLSTTHAPEIRERGEIWVPAGRSRTAFVDTRDVAAVSAAALCEPGHERQAYTPTGAEAITYDECAQAMTETLGRSIRYRRPGAIAYWRLMRRRGEPRGFVAVSSVIYLIGRMGKADGLTDDVQQILGRQPISFRTFVQDHTDAWNSTSEAQP